MAEIVNLRQARKQAARAARERAAEENRALHSLPGRLRKSASKENAQERDRHEAHRLERGETGDED